MVWQKGLVGFFDFFVPALVNWLVPAACMSMVFPKARPEAHDEHSEIKKGGNVVIALFAITVVLTVALHQYAHLPPFLGMMTGLGLLEAAAFVK